MQISPLAGQYSSVISPSRTSANRQAEVANTASAAQILHQKPDSSGQLISKSLTAQQRTAHEVSLVELVKPEIVRARMNTGQSANPATFRAVSEYQDIASQEQREELTEVLGIDVFA